MHTVKNIPKNQWQASVNLDWNIYEGGATDAQIQEKKINTSISNTALIDATSQLLT